MNKIKTEKIGEYVIVTGAGKLSIDPKGTQLGTLEKIEALPEYQEMAGAQRAKSQAIQKAGNARGRHAAILEMQAKAQKLKDNAGSKSDGKETAKYDQEVRKHQRAAAQQDQEYKDQKGVASAKNTELLEITPRFNAAQMQIKRESPSYNQPNSGEYIDRGLSVVGVDADGSPGILDDEDMPDILIPDGQTAAGLMELYLARGENQQLLLDGEYIDDFRGKQYFYNDGRSWIESETISDLGVDKNTVVVDEYQDQSFTWDELEPQYQEEIRLQRLTPEEMLAEKSVKIMAAMQASIALRSELEIKGTAAADALKQSQAFYAAELIKIDGIYGA